MQVNCDGMGGQNLNFKVCAWVQAFLVKLFEDVNFCAIHARRTTIMVHAVCGQPANNDGLTSCMMVQVKDMKLARRIRGGGHE